MRAGQIRDADASIARSGESARQHAWRDELLKTGELKTGGKKNIAAWSLDTDYDERSLYPHQVFFPMAEAKDGWNKHRKNIRAELDENALDQLHSTVSLPFEPGENRKAALKIVDDRGIESLKILPISE